MNCISLVSYLILLNGAPVGSICLARGPRQGDPLSPYLSLICTEGLFSLILTEENHGLYSGLRCGRSEKKITHLFFTDDSLLFTRTYLKECNLIKRLLQQYEKASGQIVNFNKSTICFNGQISILATTHLTNVLGMKIVGCHEKYINLPSFTFRNKKTLFFNIKDWMWAMIKGWKCRLFSAAGNEILLKAVIQAISTYAMSLF
ncbi:hypothetical protein ACOSP7_019386 [Xanthoceras sorbifolium]